MRIYITDFPCC